MTLPCPVKRIHSAVRRAPPKVNTFRPAIGATVLSAASSSSISLSGPVSAMMRAKAVCPRASARSDTPMLQWIANFASVDAKKMLRQAAAAGEIV